MIAMGLVAAWRARPSIAGLAEIIDGLTKTARQTFGAVPCVQPAPT